MPYMASLKTTDYMIKLEKKKKQLALIISSVLMVLYGLIAKDFNIDDHYLEKSILKIYRGTSIPLRYYDVNFFGIEIPFKSFIFFFTITLGVGIYSFIFEKELSVKIRKPLFLSKMKASYLKYKRKHTAIDKEDIKLQNKYQKTVEVITFLSLLFTFYLAIESMYSMWFFIILSYFYLLVLKPKSNNGIILKAIFYPLIFVVIINGLTYNEYYSIPYNLSRFILQYLISVAIIIFTQLRKFKNGYKFDFKHPLFWASSICLFAATLNFLVNQ